MLGDIYGKGEGVPQDYVQAHKWYSLAAVRLGPFEDRTAVVAGRERSAGRMTPAEIVEAQRLAREWLATHE